jgi:hypothetical protein
MNNVTVGILEWKTHSFVRQLNSFKLIISTDLPQEENQSKIFKTPIYTEQLQLRKNPLI